MTPKTDRELVELRDSAIALKALIAYLSNARPRGFTESRIIAHFPKELALPPAADGSKPKRKTTTYEKFCRVGVIDYEDTYEPVRKVVQGLIDQLNIPLPDEYVRIARAAGLNLKDDARLRQHRLPDFIGIDRLVPSDKDKFHAEIVVKAYAGCWRTYRVSSRESGSEELSVGLLNIKPWRVLKEETLELPQFSFRQMSKENRERKDWNRISAIHGILKYADRRVTLLGWRDEIGTAWPTTGMFTWSNPHIWEDSRETFIDGVSMIPNSEGSLAIAAYFVAEFIPGSDSLTGPAYEALKAKERDGYGPHPFTELSEKIENQQLLERLKTLISKSVRDVVFTA